MQVQTNQQLPVSFRYDAQGRISQRISHQEEGTPDLIRRWFYHDSSPRPARIQWEDGTESQFEYDIEGNLIRTTNPRGDSQHYQYGAFDKLIQSTDPLGASTFYFYNKEGEFSGVANSQKQQWRYQFNKAGQITEEQHYDGRVTRFEYDAVGRLIARIQPDGSQQQFKYDAAGRLLEKQNIAPDQVPTSLTQFEYNPAGQLIRAANPKAEVFFDYDSAGNLVAETLNGETISYEYNGEGDRTLLISNAVQLAFGWQQGQLTQLQVNEHNPLLIQRNRMGHELGRTNQAGFNLKQQWGKDGWFHQWLDNDTPHDQARSPVQGTAPSGPGHRSRFRQLQRSYLYNSLDQIVAIDESHWGASLFEHNANGQITRQMRRKPFDGSQPEQQDFSYDSEKNLTRIERSVPVSQNNTDTGTNVVSLAEKRLEKALKYQRAGRVESHGNHSYRYDDCGRMVEKIIRRNGFRPESTRYEWDEEDQLIRVVLPDGDSWHYQYDPFGRRIGKYHQPAKNLPTDPGGRQSVQKHRYLWDGHNLIGQQKCYADGTPAHTTHWLYEPDSFRPFAQLDHESEQDQAAPVLHYIVTDQTGTPRELCTEAGEVSWRGQQNLWGKHEQWHQSRDVQRYYQEDAANDPIVCDLRYQGQIYDQETGLHYNRFRYYDPEIAQYLTPDPIGMEGGLRPQSYVDNPIEWIDPLGLTSCNTGTSKGTHQSAEPAKPKDTRVPQQPSPPKPPKPQEPVSPVKSSNEGTYRDANGRLRTSDGKFANDGGSKKSKGLGFNTTTDSMRKAVQGKPYIDPLTNKEVTPSKDVVMSPDHIYPVSEIQKMPGFDKLNTKQQKAIIHDTVGLDNIQPLPKSLNESKSNKVDGQWKTYKNEPLSKEYIRNLTREQNAARGRIQSKIIDFFRN